MSVVAENVELPSEVVISRDTSLAEAALWRVQRDYFSELGPAAWDAAVPFRITCTPFIAAHHAHRVAAFLLDGIAAGQVNVEQPIYVLELAAGTGKFGHRFVTALQRRLAGEEPRLDVRYILSDLAQANLDALREHPAWQERIAAGTAACALFDMERPGDLVLQPTGDVLARGAFANPLVVVANYAFDSAAHELYRARAGVLGGAKITVCSLASIVRTRKPAPAHLVLDIQFPDAHPVPEGVTDSAWLRTYAASLGDGEFSVPLAAIRTFDHLVAAAGRVFVIAADYGPANRGELESYPPGLMARHGSFSWPVNFDALSAYARSRGGEAWVQYPATGLPVAVLSLGGARWGAHLRHTLAESTHGPADGLRMTSEQQQREAPDLDTALAWLRSSQWDPVLIAPLCRALKKAREIPPPVRRAMVDDLRLVENNFYRVVGSPEPDFALGWAFQFLKEPGHALRSYQRALAHAGEQAATYVNMGMCAQVQGDLASARTWLTRGVELGDDRGIGALLLRAINETR